MGQIRILPDQVANQIAAGCHSQGDVARGACVAIGVCAIDCLFPLQGQDCRSEQAASAKATAPAAN